MERGELKATILKELKERGSLPVHLLLPAYKNTVHLGFVLGSMELNGEVVMSYATFDKDGVLCKEYEFLSECLADPDSDDKTVSLTVSLPSPKLGECT